MNPKAMPGWQKDEPMTPTNDAEKAFEYIVEAFLMNDYKSVWEKEVETIRTALAKSAKVDGLLEALSEGLKYKGGWREAIAMLQDHTGDKVEIMNMLAALDQMDRWSRKAKAAIQRFNGEV